MFIPRPTLKREEMLKEIGIGSLDELFTAVPKDFRFPKLKLAAGTDRNGSAGRVDRISIRQRIDS